MRAHAEAIARAAKRLVDLREAWLQQAHAARDAAVAAGYGWSDWKAETGGLPDDESCAGCWR